jgi:hypothetical protein
MSDPVSLLLHLQRRARDAAGVAELCFVMVNETHALAPYRQAALWEAGRGVGAVSGVAVLEANAPFTLWLERICRRLGSAMAQAGPVDPALLSEPDREEWRDWLPAAGLWVPFTIPNGNRTGLLFVREEPWAEVETAMLSELAHAYGHALWALRRPSLWAEARRHLKARRRVAVGFGLALLALAAIPVPLTVLASAEVVAADPAVVRAPLDGVVDAIRVRPNDRIAEGQLLFTLDDTTLRGKVEVAEKSLTTAEAELRQLSQQAVFDPAAKPKLAVAAGRRDEQAAELATLQSQLERIRVRAPRPGIAVLDDPSEWVGRPVTVGEKVMALAEEKDTEIEAWLAPADAIDLPPGAPLTLFLNVLPLSPVHGTLKTVAYEATPRPDGTVAHRVRARIDGGEDKPRLGLRGTARLSGDRVPLAYWLLRRPIATVRAWAGL